MTMYVGLGKDNRDDKNSIYTDSILVAQNFVGTNQIDLVVINLNYEFYIDPNHLIQFCKNFGISWKTVV